MDAIGRRILSLLGMAIAIGAVAFGSQPVRNAIAATRTVQTSLTRTVPGLAQARKNAKSRTCASYQGERLYADDPINLSSDAIYVFPSDATGNTTPLCVFTSSALNHPSGGMAVDGGGKLWVVDTVDATLTAFAHASDGTVAPIQTIAGGNTLMVGFPSGGVQHPAIDATGDCWVPQWYDYNGATGYITAYSNTENGNVAPTATIGFGDKGESEGIEGPVAVVFDSLGNLYVLEYTTPSRMLVFSPPFSDTEKPVATWTIPDETAFLSVDGADDVYAASDGFVYEFKKGLESQGTFKKYRLVDRQDNGGAYDLKLNPAGTLFFAPISSIHPKNFVNEIAVLPPGVRRPGKARPVIPKGGHFVNPVNALAIGP